MKPVHICRFFTSRSLIAQCNNACWQSSRAVVVVVVAAVVVVACCCANLLLCVMPRLRVADQFNKSFQLVIMMIIVKKTQASTLLKYE